MIRSNILVAWRNLVRNRTYSILNISGLAVGMSVAILIGLWIYDEVTFNAEIKGSESISRIMQSTESNGKIETNNWTPYPLAQVLRNDYSDRFDQVVTSTEIWDHVFDLNEKRFVFEGAFMEDGGGRLLGLHMLSGSIDALKDPGSLLISASSANKMFNTTDIVGKSVKLDREHTLKIAGVYEDLSKNSDFRDLSFIGSWKHYFANTEWIRTSEEPWRPNAFVTYVKIKPGVDAEKASLAIKDVRLRHVSERLARLKPRLHLHPMNKWHLYEEFNNGVNTGGRIQYVWLFLTIGIFVLVLACINFMNLSTARSEKRAKEVGVRKTIGSLRSQLLSQFFCESLLYATLAFFVSLLLVNFTLPAFNNLAGKEIEFPWSNAAFWLSSFGFCAVTGIFAGVYPALYLSSFKPVKVLKGTFNPGRFAALPRQVLVVVQFTVSIVLIIGTIVVFRQIQYAKNRPVGYDRDGLVMIDMPGDAIHKHFDAIRNELKNDNIIVEMSEATAPATAVVSTSTGFEWEGKDPSVGVNFPVNRIAYNYGKTLGWQFLEGRDFQSEFKSDSSGIILNETAAELMGFRNKAVGKTIMWDGDPVIVVGVIKDLITESPYANVRPSVFVLNTYAGGVLIAKLSPSVNVPTALKRFEKIFKQHNPDHDFNAKFVNEEYDRKFGNEERLGKLAAFFAALAIFISCLGLFGMASFVAQQRSKEIGVRKVLGASVAGICRLLSIDFVKLVVISLLLAVPIAWYFMTNWLQGYTYHPALSAWIFVFAGAGAVLITVLTVSYQSIRAALANPVKSLKSE
ncbi:MAG: ABC transporter permease [Flavitalea sp.]